MSLASKLLSAAGGVDKLYVDDVFSAYTYTGNGATQTITNNIDLASKGGLVWTKCRSAAFNNNLHDTARGVNNYLVSDTTGASANPGSNTVTAFNSDGYSIGAASSTSSNTQTFVSWTFRKAPKFFDVVTYTGTGSNRTIAHSLGSVPGMIAVKRTDSTGSWMVYHNSIANTENLVLNTTAAKTTNATAWNSTTATSSVFSLGTHADVNTNGASYVAYLFAHDTSADGLIQCGSYVGAGVSGQNITLGFEPQFVMVKRTTGAANWVVVDVQREMPVNTGGARLLYPSLSNAETSSGGGYVIYPTATGFMFPAGLLNDTLLNSSGDTFVYMAIRRPNKPPTTGTQVYNAIARTGTGAAATVTGVGFAPDLVLACGRSSVGAGFPQDRLRGANVPLLTSSALSESSLAPPANDTVRSFDMDGYSTGMDSAGDNINTSGRTLITHIFKRAPGVFDEVCDTGTGASHTISHNLGAVPELMIRKGRSGATQWEAYCSSLANTEKLILNSTAAKATDTTSWNSTTPSSTTFTVGTGANVNTSAATYVTYLFASLAGISKVFSYTGNGSSQTVACGFTTGARFILIKRTDAAGDWYVWDTTRGIIAGSDPHLSLNTTAAEVTTDDSIDPDASGFIVNQLAATNINVTSATYIGLAFA